MRVQELIQGLDELWPETNTDDPEVFANGQVISEMGTKNNRIYLKTESFREHFRIMIDGNVQQTVYNWADADSIYDEWCQRYRDNSVVGEAKFKSVELIQVLETCP